MQLLQEIGSFAAAVVAVVEVTAAVAFSSFSFVNLLAPLFSQLLWLLFEAHHLHRSNRPRLHIQVPPSALPVLHRHQPNPPKTVPGACRVDTYTEMQKEKTQ